ncbi:tRNA epoxyqueuosine(34) reductase QueG [Alkanindiges illinoisensis]|uniref:Epoxyqueuosine reductase n=1 Tax=Alkanindiges illinoisensis TaxID=197183 RepID=A0A4Y7XDZ5_9GAMM|nr:tRNA epoxyqueuosine(34) reductase QueG [Alkanindiges illinoisensis]TEU29380.1 tRNA epoxyqueuosine(34) reductase QueG [Alkanindiges illinoisensis]
MASKKATIPVLDETLRQNPQALKEWIKAQARQLGFSDCGIARPDTQDQIPHLQQYLADGFHADMDYLATNLDKRANPALLVPDTRSIICVRMDYLAEAPPHRYVPHEPNQAIIARYARGRDYHKVLRGRLKQLARVIEEKVGPFESRPFADSAPIFEKALAEKSGLGWTGKHTLLINKKAGSFFFLGELFTSLDLPFDEPATAHCGSCSACLDICPTKAIVAPYRLDARKCIAYLTIEYQGIIPEEFRKPIGNRVFGCDDCQLICPWNGFAQLSGEDDFKARHHLNQATLLELWQWTEQEFLSKTEGSAIRRTGYQGFMRNVAIGLGNADFDPQIIAALQQSQHDEVVQVHVDWALTQQQLKMQAV